MPSTLFPSPEVERFRMFVMKGERLFVHFTVYPNNIIQVDTLAQLLLLKQSWLTVHAIQEKYGRSRSWAYHHMSKLCVYEVQWRSGEPICRVVSAKAFAEHVRHIRRRGNPNWG